MKNVKFFFTIAVTFFTTSAFCITWDEPWQEEILEKSESFVLLKVDSVDQHTGIWATVIKTLAGETIEGDVYIDDFFALRLTSISGGDHAEFRLPSSDSIYFFLVRGPNGNYQMPTPTSGYAHKRGNTVVATYRISMHKALVEVAMYEKSMAELFRFSKTGDYDQEYFTEFFTKYLTQVPGKVDGNKEERELFFKQHVALESFYYVGEEKYYADVEQFLNSDQLHNQIGGIRALSILRTKASRDRLLDFVKDDTRSNLARVLSLESLRRLNAKELSRDLKKYAKKASTEDVDFGLNVMDVRVGTHLSRNLQNGITSLLSDWKRKTR